MFSEDSRFDALMSNSDFLSMFTDWESRHMSTVWCGYKYS